VKRAAVLLVLALAGCGGSQPPRDHATLVDVRVRPSSVEFSFDSAPHEATAAYARGPLAECGSGAPVRPHGVAVVVVHFAPAQTGGVPRRILMQSAGPVADVWKFCDFEADVSWAVGLDRRLPVHVSRDGATVTVTFGR
jgi:hypothetical protein